MSLYIVIGMALMASLILGIIGTFNSGFKKGKDEGYYTGWNECNQDHLEKGNITTEQVQ